MAVYAYTRVSTVGQALEGLSLAEQERQVTVYAMTYGWSIDRLFVEDGVSGGKPLATRPAGAELTALVRRGDIVIVSKLDRIFRRTIDALDTIKTWRAQGIVLHLLDLGGNVTGEGLGQLM